MAEKIPGETSQQFYARHDDIHAKVLKLYSSFVNKVTSPHLQTISLNISLLRSQSLPPKDLDAGATPVRMPAMGRTREVAAEEVKGVPRRTVYTPLSRTYAFDREVDYVPYFDDGTADTVTKILQKHKKKIGKRWIMSKYDTERKPALHLEKWKMCFCFWHSGDRR